MRTTSIRPSRLALCASALLLVEIGFFALGALPHPIRGIIPGFRPDSHDYVFGAKALLHGQYVVSIDGQVLVPRYAPGFAALLVPAVALGDVEAAVWVSYAAALAVALLVAFLAWRVSGPLAAPLAVAPLLFTSTMVLFAQIVMSDVPALAIALLSLALVVATQHRAPFITGLLLGALAWIRPAMLVLSLAGLLTLRDRRDIPRYGVGVALPTLGLLLWQWVTFGSPLTSGYQAAGATDTNGQLFALRYLFGPAYNAAGGPPNLVAYIASLFGPDGELLWPGVGIVGVIGLIWLARGDGSRSVVGRFGLVAIGLMLGVHTLYFFQSQRYMFLPAALLAIGAGALVADLISAVLRWLPARLASVLSQQVAR